MCFFCEFYKNFKDIHFAEKLQKSLSITRLESQGLSKIVYKSTTYFLNKDTENIQIN